MSERINVHDDGSRIKVGYEPSATEQALVQRVHELEGKLEAAERRIEASSKKTQKLINASEELIRILRLERDDAVSRAEEAEFNLKAAGFVIEEMQRRANR